MWQALTWPKGVRGSLRAARSGNFVRFFRLARRATYLQACLMHAHFATVRGGGQGWGG